MRHILRIFLATASLALAVFTLPANASSPEPSYLQRFFADSPDVGYLETAQARSKKRMHFRGISPRADHKPGIHSRHRHGAKGIRMPHRHTHKPGAKCLAYRDARPMASHRLHEPQLDLPRARAHKKVWGHGHPHSHMAKAGQQPGSLKSPYMRKLRRDLSRQSGERPGYRTPTPYAK